MDKKDLNRKHGWSTSTVNSKYIRKTASKNLKLFQNSEYVILVYADSDSVIPRGIRKCKPNLILRFIRWLTRGGKKYE